MGLEIKEAYGEFMVDVNFRPPSVNPDDDWPEMEFPYLVDPFLLSLPSTRIPCGTVPCVATIGRYSPVGRPHTVEITTPVTDSAYDGGRDWGRYGGSLSGLPALLRLLRGRPAIGGFNPAGQNDAHHVGLGGKAERRLTDSVSPYDFSDHSVLPVTQPYIDGWLTGTDDTDLPWAIGWHGREDTLSYAYSYPQHIPSITADLARYVSVGTPLTALLGYFIEKCGPGKYHEYTAHYWGNNHFLTVGVSDFVVDSCLPGLLAVHYVLDVVLSYDGWDQPGFTAQFVINTQLSGVFNQKLPFQHLEVPRFGVAFNVRELCDAASVDYPIDWRLSYSPLFVDFQLIDDRWGGMESYISSQIHPLIRTGTDLNYGSLVRSPLGTPIPPSFRVDDLIATSQWFNNRVSQYGKDLRAAAYYSFVDAVSDLSHSYDLLQSILKIVPLSGYIPDVASALRVVGEFMTGVGIMPTMVNVLRFVSGEYLRYSFQQRPTLELLRETLPTLRTVCDAIGGLASADEVVLRGSFSFDFPYREFGRDESHLHVTTTICVSPREMADLVPYLQLRSLGVVPDARFLWDITPYSFVVNWLVDIGPNLGRIHELVISQLLPIKWIIHSYTITSPLYDTELARFGLAGSSSDDRPSLRIFQREVTQWIPLPRDSRWQFSSPAPVPSVLLPIALLIQQFQ